MEEQSGYSAKMWGPAIVGFGNYHYKYESGHEGDAPMAGFSPRANAITLYIATDYPAIRTSWPSLVNTPSAKACIYVKKLANVDTEVLKTMVRESVKYMKEKYKNRSVHYYRLSLRGTKHRKEKSRHASCDCFVLAMTDKSSRYSWREGGR